MVFFDLFIVHFKYAVDDHESVENWPFTLISLEIFDFTFVVISTKINEFLKIEKFGHQPSRLTSHLRFLSSKRDKYPSRLNLLKPLVPRKRLTTLFLERSTNRSSCEAKANDKQQFILLKLRVEIGFTRK